MPNTAPSGTDLTRSVPRSYTLHKSDFGFSDADGNGFKAVVVTTLPGAGTLYYDSNGSLGGHHVAVTAGQVISAADILAGKLTFVAPAGVSGANYDHFTFQVQDDGGTVGGGVDIDPSANTLTFDLVASAATPTFFGSLIDLTSLSAPDGFTIQGDLAGDQAGYSVSAAGDVNGDGFADLIVGALYNDNGGNNAGAAYVIFGKASGFASLIDLTGLAASDGFMIQGDLAVDLAGASVSSAGDVNGDGFSDLIVGAWGNDSGGGTAGAAYVIFGKSGGFGSLIDLTGLAATDGFKIQGDLAGDEAGASVSSAGDVNGDGFADLIVGALANDSGGNAAGAAYVIFGKSGGFGSLIDLTGLAATAGFKIQGDLAGDQAGYGVSAAGDVNGDGVSDLIVGAPKNDSGGTDAGAAYVIFGKSGGFGSLIDLTNLSATDGFKIQGDLAGDEAGRSVSSAGDVNGDGYADIIVGARGNDSGGNNAGAAYVIFGKSGGFGSLIDLTGLSATDGFKIQGDLASDSAGSSVSSAGDVNGDGFADLLVGAQGNDSGGSSAGAAYLIFGKASGFGSLIDLTGLSATDGFKIQGDLAYDNAGRSVSSAGDLNGDGFADLMVGATRNASGGTNAGAAYVIFGRANVAVNAPPVLDLNGSDAGTSVSVTTPERTDINPIAPAATLTDPDSADFNGGSLTVSFGAAGTATDFFIIHDDGGVYTAGRFGADGNGVYFNKVLFGTRSGGIFGQDLVVTLNANATPQAVEALVHNIGTFNDSDAPPSGARTVTFTVTDGDGGTAQADASITIVAQNDAPVNGVPGAQTVNEDAQLAFGSSHGNAISVSDVDAGAGNLTVTLSVAHGLLTLGGTNGLVFGTGDGSADATMTFTGAAAAINTALEGLTYAPAANYNGADTLSITTNDNGNSGGGAQQDVDTVALNIAAVNDAPTATITPGSGTLAPVGNEILVNTATSYDQSAEKITALSNGGFVVTWTDASSGLGGATGDSSQTAVKAQVFAAGGTPVGSEILVNTATAGNQTQQQITALSNGGFVVTWRDNSMSLGGATGDNSSLAIKAQVFTVGGALVGSEILVNSATESFQQLPQITALSNGGFVVTWQDNSQGAGGATGDNSSLAVKAQVFAAGGTPVGSEILVNTATASLQETAKIAALANGGFVVTWEDYSQSVGGATGDASGFAVKAQVFAANGTPVGGEHLVNTATVGDQNGPQITALANGGFVVTWNDASQGGGGAGGDASGNAVKAQVFAADGTPVGGEHLVNTATNSGQGNPQITALANGGFVVTWQDYSQGVGGATGDTGGYAVKAQVFAADGTPVGGEHLVNTATEGDQSTPQITSLANGGFVVTWQDYSQGAGGATSDATGFAVKAQVFAADGTPVGGEHLVNTATASDQTTPQITALSNGGFVVTWLDSSAGIGGATGDFSGLAIKAQVFGSAPWQAVEQTALSLKGGLAVADVDGGSGIETATVTADYGILHLAAGTSGATITNNDSGAVTITGTIAQINALLSSDGTSVVTYTANSDAPPGSATLTLLVNDGGNTGSGGELTGSATTVIDIAAVNDAPTATITPGGGAFGPAGNEILVNTATQGDQSGAQITALANGGFVVTWSDLSQGVGGATGDTSFSAVKAQVFAADGTPVGGEQLVNTAADGDQLDPKITALANGGFVVTWTDSSQGSGGNTGDTDSSAVKAQVFAADGTPVGGELLVNSATNGDQFTPQITALANGGFVVTWSDFSQGVGGATGDASGYAVKAQVFAADGTPVGGEHLVNTATQGFQFNPQITALAAGGFVVTWEDPSQGAGGATGDTSGFAVKAQVFAANGTPVGGEHLVNTATNSTQSNPHITALANGGFVVAWQDISQGVGGATGDTSSYAVKAQVFAADGTPVGGEHLVNTATAGEQINPQITALANGGFVVTWQDNGQGIGGATGDSSDSAVKAQVFTADGTRVGGEHLVNTATEGDQLDSRVVALANGGFVVTWNDNSQGAGGATGDTSGYAVKAQAFAADGSPAGGEFLVNTATDNYQFNPQITALANGGFVVTWDDSSGGLGGATGDFSGNAVKAQVFGPAPYQAVEQVALSLKGGLAVADADGGSGIETATVSVDSGILHLAAGTSGATIANNDSGAVTITGTIAQINALLSTDGTSAITYTANSDTPPGSATLTLLVNDGGNTGSGGALTGSATTTIGITAVNDAPVNAVPATQAINEDAQLVFNSANGNAISVSDADAGAGTVTVTLDIEDGALTLGGTSGLVVTGEGGNHVVLTGTIAAINAGLDNLSYQPGQDASGARTLTVSTDDGGHSGTGGAQQDVDTIAINIAPVDDAPVAVTDSVIVAENAVATIAVLDNDTDADGGQKDVVSIDGMALSAGQSVTLATGAIVTLNNDGTLGYDPNHQFDYLVSAATATATGASDASATDSFSYALNGGSSTTVIVTIDGVDSAGDHLNGDGGDNGITGTPNPDYFDLSQGGDDVVNGLGSNDGFFFGATLTAADQVDGGSGTNDQVGLQGDYTGGNALVLGANTIVNIEAIVLLPGFSYDITTNDGNVAAGGVLQVQATQLAANESLHFDGSAETDGSFKIFGGNGDDNLTGGAKDDGFYFGPGQFNASDVVNGGAGTNDQLGLDGDYGSAGSPLELDGNLSNVEVVVLLPGPSGTPNHFDLTTSEGFVPSGQTATIFGVQVTTDIVFDGSNEHDGAFKIYGGSGNDTITGGGGADWIFGGNGADSLTGGAGNDIFYYDAVAQSTAANSDTISDFATGDKVDLSAIDAIVGGANDGFTFLGSGAFTSQAGELRAENIGGSTWLVQGDTNGDGVADFQLTLITSDAHPIATGDFTL